MARLLNSVGTVSYNGFTFPAPFDAEVTSVPRRDSSGRYIKYVTYTITISTIIVPDDAPTSTAGSAVDTNLENIRCRLQKSGGSLRFNDQGLGTNLSINTSGGGRIDPTFGPHPTILTWRPTGTNRAAQIVWSVEVTIPECCETIVNASQAFIRLLEHNYTISWDINEEGSTVRIIQGRFEVPGYRTGVTIGSTSGPLGRTAPNTADKHWNRIFDSFPRVPGFQRESRRSLSQDRRVMEYVITDKEIASDNPYFPYMVKMDLRHRASIQFPNYFKVRNNISGSITIAPKAPRHWAWLAFSKVLFERLKLGGLAPKSRNGPKGKATVAPRSFITSLVWDENLYGRDFVFSVDWWNNIGALQQVFRSNGLFTAVTGSSGASDVLGTAKSWAAWTVSMGAVANHARGLAQMQHVPANDIMINVCDDQFIPVTNNLTSKNLAGIEAFPLPQEPTKPTPESSWGEYKQTIVPTTQNNVIRHQKLSQQNIQSTVATDENPNTTEFNLQKLGPSDSGQAGDSVIEQIRGAAVHTFRLIGSAIRFGYPVPLPTVKGVGGKVAHLLESNAVQSPIGEFNGIPIYAAAWNMEYSLTAKPVGDLMATINGDALKDRI
jgi:hypothetical protein